MTNRLTLLSLLLALTLPLLGQIKSYDELRENILTNIHGAVIPPSEYNVVKFGAKGDGAKDCLPAFRKAFAKIAKTGGGKLVVPAGTYMLRGPLHLVSNLQLQLNEGATLLFDPTPELYPVVETSWEGTYIQNYSPLIYGRNLENVAITGDGTIDGNAMTTFATWRPKQKDAQMRSRQMNHDHTPVAERNFGKGDYLRPHLIQLYGCQGVTLEGVKITNSPFWCVHLLQCRDAICRSLRYDAKLVNNDGIDPESSSYVLIEDIHFDNGDDNIAIKSGRDDDGRLSALPCENILIRNCHFKGLHAVVMGSEMSGGVRNVLIEDCDYAGYCKRGIYVKTNPDRGGFVEDIYVRNCRFDRVEDLFYITSRYAGEGVGSTNYPRVRNIHVDGLYCTAVSAAALVLQGTSVSPVRQVSFDNVEVGEAVTGISFTDTEDVLMGRCIIGPIAGTPTQITKKDRIFEQ
ncbi:MAG: glycoside hydrolase family 28 protein [Muribaculaceae bacterium]|nr:glycoside hydrolase family 28 protein [Muribaculaceae bacterium]